MTEQQILAFAWRLGPWAGLVICVTYIIANKVGPIWLDDWREQRRKAREALDVERQARIEEEREDRKNIILFYERLMAQNSEMTKFIANASEAIHEFTRAMDLNTLQLYRLTQAVNELQK
jgi:hypothetical protein